MARIPGSFTGGCDIPEDCLFGTDIVGSPILRLVIFGNLESQKIFVCDKVVEVPNGKIYLGNIQFCYPIAVSIYNRPYTDIDNVNLETYASFKTRTEPVEVRLVEFSHKQSRTAVTDKIKAVWGVYYYGYSALLSCFVLEPTLFISSVRELCSNVLTKCKEREHLTAFDLMGEINLKEINKRNNPDAFKSLIEDYYVD